MLNETELHYVVGLLVVSSNLDALTVQLGDRVLDCASETHRDVDITVTIPGQDAGTRVFKGIEVKGHRRPLNVIHVEQLCAKLKDMPSVTSAAIVSASGYTVSAAKKARAHGTALLDLIDWRGDRDELPTRFDPDFKVTEEGFHWVHAEIVLGIPETLTYGMDTPVCDSAGMVLDSCPDVATLAKNLASSAAECLKKGNPPRDVIFDLERLLVLKDEPRVQVDGELYTVYEAMIRGALEWQSRTIDPAFKILVDHDTREPFAGCAVWVASDDSLYAAAFGQDQVPRLSRVSLPNRLKKAIYQERYL